MALGDLEGPVVFAEFNWTRLLERMPSAEEKTYRAVSRFPTVERDLAFVVNSAQPVGPMLEEIRVKGGDLLKEVGVFDVYEGERMGSGKKSIAFYLRFTGDRTLTDDEVDGLVSNIVQSVASEFDADLRE